MEVKYSHEQIVDFLKERLPQYQKEVFERQRQTDNVVVWLVGLSTGAIALILSQSNNQPLINILFLKIATAFFLLTVIAGVIFRAFFYILEQIESDLLLGLEGYCYGTTCKVYGPINLTEYHTIEQIAKSLKEDMGLNYDDWLDKGYLTRDFWVDLYNKWAEFWRKTEEEGFKGLGRAFAPLVGKRPEEAEGFFLKKQDNAKSFQKRIILGDICNWAYNLLMIFFVLGIASLATGFFIK